MDADNEQRILKLAKDYHRLIPNRHLVLICGLYENTIEVVDLHNKYLGTLNKRGLRGNIGVEMVQANRIMEAIQALL